MHPIGTPLPQVTVEYDANGTRKTKTFDDPYAGRRFFCAKDRAGKNPQVVKGPQTMTANTTTTKPSKATKPAKAKAKAPAKPKPKTEPKATKTIKVTKVKVSSSATKPAKKEVLRDAFGNREGTQAAAINAVLTSKPQTVKAIADATSFNPGRVRDHLKFLLNKKLIAQSETEAGIAFAIAKTKPAKLTNQTV